MERPTARDGTYSHPVSGTQHDISKSLCLGSPVRDAGLRPQHRTERTVANPIQHRSARKIESQGRWKSWLVSAGEIGFCNVDHLGLPQNEAMVGANIMILVSIIDISCVDVKSCCWVMFVISRRSL
jgi:hypothetical protein